MDELFEKMQKVIAEKLDIDADKVKMESNLRADLGADSLDSYDMIYAIEEETGVQIPDDVANTFETVQNVYDYIKSQQN